MKALIASGLLLIAVSALFAHAVLVRSQPSVNQNVPGPTVPIELTFNSRVDAKRSTLSAESPEHRVIELKIKTGASNAEKLVSSLDNAKPGQYHLRWQVLSVDGHITRGAIPFQVK